MLFMAITNFFLFPTCVVVAIYAFGLEIVYYNCILPLVAFSDFCNIQARQGLSCNDRQNIVIEQC